MKNQIYCYLLSKIESLATHWNLILKPARVMDYKTNTQDDWVEVEAIVSQEAVAHDDDTDWVEVEVHVPQETTVRAKINADIQADWADIEDGLEEATAHNDEEEATAQTDEEEWVKIDSPRKQKQEFNPFLCINHDAELYELQSSHYIKRFLFSEIPEVIREIESYNIQTRYTQDFANETIIHIREMFCTIKESLTDDQFDTFCNGMFRIGSEGFDSTRMYIKLQNPDKGLRLYDIVTVFYTVKFRIEWGVDHLSMDESLCPDNIDDIRESIVNGFYQRVSSVKESLTNALTTFSEKKASREKEQLVRHQPQKAYPKPQQKAHQQPQQKAHQKPRLPQYPQPALMRQVAKWTPQQVRQQPPLPPYPQPAQPVQYPPHMALPPQMPMYQPQTCHYPPTQHGAPTIYVPVGFVPTMIQTPQGPRMTFVLRQ